MDHVISPTEVSADEFTAGPMPQLQTSYPQTFRDVMEQFRLFKWDGK